MHAQLEVQCEGMFGSTDEQQKLEREVVWLKERLDGERRTAQAQRSADLRELASARQDVELLRAELASERDRLRAELATERGRGDEHLTRAVSALERVSELERRCAAAESAAESAVAERRTACDATRALEKELAATRRSLAEALARYASLEAERDEAAARGACLSSELAAARVEAEALRMARDETATARAEADALRREVEALRKAASSRRPPPPPEEPTPASPPAAAPRRPPRRAAARATEQLAAAAAAPAPAQRGDATRPEAPNAPRRGGRGGEQRRAPPRGHYGWDAATLEKALLALRDGAEDDETKERIWGLTYKVRGGLRNLQTLAANYGQLRSETLDAVVVPALIGNVCEMLAETIEVTRTERASAMALREAERVVRVVQTDDAALLYSLLERVASIEAQERVSVEQLRLDKARAIADLGVVAIKLLSAACASSGATDAASCWRIFCNDPSLPWPHLSRRQQNRVRSGILTVCIFDAFDRPRVAFRIDGDVSDFWYYKVLRMTLTDAAMERLGARAPGDLRGQLIAQAVLDAPYLVDVRTDIECPLVHALAQLSEG